MPLPALLDEDHAAIQHAAKLQTATKQALDRIQTQVTSTELVGCTTLGELTQQRDHLERILVEGDRLEVSLNTTDKLLNRYSRIGLRFGNASAAQRLVKKEGKFRKSLEDKAKERAAEISREISTAHVEPLAVPVAVVTKHSQSREQRNSRTTKNSASDITNTTPRKSLLFGSSNASVAPMVQEELQQLEETDAEIEVQLDGIGSQIEELLRMSNEVAGTVQSQDKGLQHVNRQLERATEKQQVANHRSRWFLTGKKRESYERKDFFNRHSMMRNIAVDRLKESM